MLSSSGIAIGFLMSTAFWAVVVLFCNEPAWIKDYAGPLATAFAATVAGWIAYTLGQGQLVVAKTQADVAERNWKTSNEKIVLELMERRLAIYREIRGVIAEINSSGKGNYDTIWKYAKATDQVEFLFRTRGAGISRGDANPSDRLRVR
jgi:hypothetical protein